MFTSLTLRSDGRNIITCIQLPLKQLALNTNLEQNPVWTK